MAVLGTAAFIGTFIASFFIESQPDPKIMAALDTIQVVVNQTYALLKDVRAELDVIEGTLAEIKDQILSLECASLLQQRVDNFATIDKYFNDYNTTNLPLVQRKALAKQALTPTEAAEIDGWASNVVDNVEKSMLAIGYALAGNDVIRPDQTVIASCGKFFAREAAKSDPFSADDRVAYFQSTSLTASMLMIVNRAANLLSEAHLWRAQRAYRTALGSYLTANCSGNITLCPTFGTPDMPIALGELCARALADPSSALPYSAAWTSCNLNKAIEKNARDITLRAMELLGAPYSWGEVPGQGVRLVLGTDVVRYQNTSVPYFLPSMWLVPASPGAFDPACTLPNATAGAGCSLVGDFGDTSNATWAHLSYPLGIEAKYWQASPDPWAIMR